MAAIAFPIADEVEAIADNIEAFLRAEVFPRHARDHDLLSNPRRTYAEDGRYTPDVVRHIREVRTSSSIEVCSLSATRRSNARSVAR